MDNIQNIIIDNGSGITKAGLSTDKIPRSVFPTIYGNPRFKGFIIGSKSQDFYVGNQALSRYGILNIINPIESGTIKNFEAIEKLFQYTFEEELHINQAEHPVIYTESLKMSRPEREKILEIIFEKFQVPSFLMCNQSLLSIYSTRKSTGIVVDVGHELTQVVPVVENEIKREASSCLEFGGLDINRLLLKSLNEKGNSISIDSGMLLVSEIKEKSCYVALDYENEKKKSSNAEFETEDGGIIKLFDTCFSCPEAIFNPKIANLKFPPLQNVVLDSIMKSDDKVRNDLCDNIVLCGGSTLFKGFVERFSSELNALTRDSYKINIFSPEKRQFSAWIGGAIVSSLDQFQSMSIKKDEYKEKGSKVLESKLL